MATMMYRYPRKHKNQRPTTGFIKADGLEFDYLVIEDDLIDEAKKSGWHLTLDSAKSNIAKSEAKIPSRDILEDKATKLGIKYRSDISDDTLYKKILEVTKG